MANKKLSDAAREARREYYRKYRETHKERIEENRRRYWERKAGEQSTESEAKNEQEED